MRASAYSIVLIMLSFFPIHLSAGTKISCEIEDTLNQIHSFEKGGNKSEQSDRGDAFIGCVRTKAVEDVRYMHILGYMYEAGYIVALDKVEAARHYKRAADLGYATSIFALARFYFNGISVEKDEGKFLELLGEAAEKGSSKAQFNLGGMYAKGEFYKKDYEKGSYWLLRAAQQNHVKAQLLLGLTLLEKGKNKESIRNGWFWLNVAAAAGSEGARKLLTKYSNEKLEASDDDFVLEKW